MVKCEICGFNNPDGFAYCGRCGNGLSSNSAIDASFISSAIEGERKQVTVLFADISGFTALNDDAKSPDQVERVLYIVNKCLDMLSEVVYEYDGYIDKYMGDAIMAVFGAPRSHEDDPERALRAALAMRERLEEFNRHPPYPLAEPLGIHLGINTGTVIAGVVGTKRKRAYTVMGDAVNVASRLESVSERDKILVSQDTYHLTSRIFKFKNRKPVHVKGKQAPLVIYELIDLKRQYVSQRGISGLRAPMVGRQKQFATLQQQVTNLQNGQGGITVVVGEAGLGKSRLVSELYQKTVSPDSSIIWLEGRGLSYRQNQSYKLFIEILRTYLGVGPETASDVVWRELQAVGPELFHSREIEVIPYLATLMGLKLEEKYTQAMPLSDPLLLQQRMFLAVGEWVEAIITKQPVILVFEDLHWADPNSVTLVQYLMTITTRLPLLLICITRPDRETPFWKVKESAIHDYPDVCVELQLEPLTQSQSRSLVDQLLQVEELPNALEQLILNRSEGNPLFVEEVLRSLIEEETIVKQNSHWAVARPITEIDIPETLTGVLTSRIDRLDEPVKRILQIASVIGRVFPRSVLKAVSDDVADSSEQLDQCLNALVKAELIRERTDGSEKEYIFKHVLTYETTYNTLLLQQRRYYHKRIADHMAPMYYLRGEEYASIVAHHYEQGEVWDRALTYLIRAAEASRAAFDNVNAVDFYTKALNISLLVSDLDPQTLPQLHEGRGRILKRLGRVDQARADFEQALYLAKANQNLTTQMRVLGELGTIHTGHHKFSQAAPYFEQALDIARRVDDKQGLVDTLNQLGEFKFNMGQLTAASAYYHEAMQIAQELGNTQRITSSQNGLATVILYQGELAASIERLENVARTWRDIGNYQGLMKTYGGLATAYNWLANYAQSNQVCRDALEIQERTGDLNWAPNFSFCMAQNALAQGNLHQAYDNFNQTTQTSLQLENSIWQTMGLLGTGYFHLIIGQPASALTQIEEAVAKAEATGSPLWASRARRMLGVVNRYQNNLAKAQTILEAELADMRQLGFAVDQVEILSELLELHLNAQQWDKIHPLVTRLIELIIPSSMKAHHAKTLRASAQLAVHHRQYEHALSLLLQARDIAINANNKLLETAVEVTMVEPLHYLKRSEQVHQSLHRVEQLLNSIADTLEPGDLKSSFLAISPLATQLQQVRQSIKG